MAKKRKKKRKKTSPKEPATPRGRTGFALLPPEERKKMGRRGGKRAHKNGAAHTFTGEEARIAGRKGGKAKYARRKQDEESK